MTVSYPPHPTPKWVVKKLQTLLVRAVAGREPQELDQVEIRVSLRLLCLEFAAKHILVFKRAAVPLVQQPLLLELCLACLDSMVIFQSRVGPGFGAFPATRMISFAPRVSVASRSSRVCLHLISLSPRPHQHRDNI